MNMPSKHSHRPPRSADKGRVRAGENPGPKRIHVSAVPDIVLARQYGRELAERHGFSGTQATLIATMISELSRNMILYANGGMISVSAEGGNPTVGIVICAEDAGPGISNIDRVMMGGYSTSGGLGIGLCGVQRIADEFKVDTKQGKGTTVTVTKWLE